MMRAKCPKCKKKKPLTKHSKTGDHQPPFKLMCRDCHDKEHGFGDKRVKYNRKYQPGTKRMHKKK